MKIKICGICNVSDAQNAVQQGAEYIGLIFIESSPRYIEPMQARKIVRSLPQGIFVVGVFQNSSREEMENIASFVGLSLFQLHGNETPALCASLSKPVIKVFQISQNLLENISCSTLYTFDFENQPSSWFSVLQNYQTRCSHFLFDKPKNIKQSNWLDCVSPMLSSIEDNLEKYFLAGGLTASNIGPILKLLSPSVVDITSGVEHDVRIKSSTLLAEFFSEVRAKRGKCDLVKRGNYDLFR